jgi:hypothetical protein
MIREFRDLLARGKVDPAMGIVRTGRRPHREGTA